MGTVYVTGHRNPDTDSIAAAIGYAELKGRVDPRNEYVPVRLGELNAQTRWVLDRAGAQEPDLLPQDRAVKLLERRTGIDPQFLHERAACVLVDLQRLGLPSGAVEREHEVGT